MAMTFVERAAKNWNAAKINYLRAAIHYDREEYGKALGSIDASIALYHKIPVPPLGAYFLRHMIRHDMNYRLIIAHRREVAFSIHRQPPLHNGPI